MPDVLLTDDVWERLDPSTGRLSRRDRRRCQLATAVVIALVVGAGFVSWAGYLQPRLVAEATGLDTAAGPRTFTVLLEVRNDGLRPVDLLEVGRSGPGLELIGSTGGHARLPGRSVAPVTLTYRVTDCDAVLQRQWAIPVRIRGSGTSWLHPASVTLGSEIWQVAAAQPTCYPDDSSG
jgi:hypothetical protein